MLNIVEEQIWPWVFSHWGWSDVSVHTTVSANTIRVKILEIVFADGYGVRAPSVRRVQEALAGI